MKDVENENIVDLFSEELSKRERKQEKKIAKMKAKEKRKQDKAMKKLEKMEDIEYAKKLKEKEQQNGIVEAPIKKEKNNKHPFLNFILGLFMIILFLVTLTYLFYNVFKETNLEQIINSSILCTMVLFYELSILISKTSIKKFFQILATISITLFMCYHLWII